MIPRPVKRAIRKLVAPPAAPHPPAQPVDAAVVTTALQPGIESDTVEVQALRGLIDSGFPHIVVDVGAHDGRRGSNSWPFVKEGWNAVLVEPHPSTYGRLATNLAGYPNARLVQGAIGAEPGEFPLFEGLDGDLTTSTLSTDENKWMDLVRGESTVMVQVETLTSLLDRHDIPTDFSFLLVDAEGMDYDVLLGLRPASHRPRIIVTEEYLFNVEKHNAKYRLLLDNGYAFFRTVDCNNSVWVANEWVETCRHNEAAYNSR